MSAPESQLQSPHTFVDRLAAGIDEIAAHGQTRTAAATAVACLGIIPFIIADGYVNGLEDSQMKYLQETYALSLSKQEAFLEQQKPQCGIYLYALLGAVDEADNPQRVLDERSGDGAYYCGTDLNVVQTAVDNAWQSAELKEELRENETTYRRFQLLLTTMQILGPLAPAYMTRGYLKRRGEQNSRHTTLQPWQDSMYAPERQIFTNSAYAFLAGGDSGPSPDPRKDA